MWALILIGLAALGGAGWEAGRMAKLNRHGLRTTGVVVRDHVRDRDRWPIVAFRDPEGVEHEVKMRQGRDVDDRAFYPIGQQVPMVYLPGRPDTAQPDSESYRNKSIAIITVVGLAFLGIGLALALRR